TLQATALVHEAYLRLVGVDKPQHWDGRKHFLASAAEAMRRILVDKIRQWVHPLPSRVARSLRQTPWRSRSGEALRLLSQVWKFASPFGSTGESGDGVSLFGEVSSSGGSGLLATPFAGSGVAPTLSARP